MLLFIMKFKVWSNLLFLIPLLISIQYGLYWYLFIIGLAFVFSTTYHLRNETMYAFHDFIFSSILIISNFYLLFKGNINSNYSLVALGISVFAIYFQQRALKYSYDFNHGVWHILSALICIFSLISFVN